MKRNIWENMTLEEKIAYLDECAAAAEMRFKKKWNSELIEMLNEKISAGNRLTVEEFEMYTGIKFSHSMTGKMEGIISISTCCLLNPLCRARIEKKIGICAECFAEALALAKQPMTENTCYNYKVLSSIELPDALIPYIDAAEARVESFGDAGTVTQCVNYIKVAVFNRHCKVTIWTKNPWLYDMAFKKLGITCPENLTVILSSQYMNKEAVIPEKYRYFIKKTFTVYTAAWLLANNKDMSFINCGGRKCKECQRCYKNADKTAEAVRELLKKDTAKVEKAGWTWSDAANADDVKAETAKTDYSNLFFK